MLAAELKSGYHTCTSGVHVPTEPSVSRDRVFRFGSFELSEREGELRKSGVRIKLQEQPFRVLVELVANAGRLVSREDLHQKLWPSDTFVDFDVGLNSAIRKLRQALNDDAKGGPSISDDQARSWIKQGQALLDLAHALAVANPVS